jgi:HAD superfamily hydrolase (TIGR01662 family)
MEPIAWIVQANDLSDQRRPAVFLDRDGVLNHNRADYVRTWAQVQFLPGVFEAMQRLSSSPFVVVVVTNQSAVGRGLMTVEGLATINQGIVAHRILAPRCAAAGCTWRYGRCGTARRS